MGVAAFRRQPNVYKTRHLAPGAAVQWRPKRRDIRVSRGFAQLWRSDSAFSAMNARAVRHNLRADGASLKSSRTQIKILDWIHDSAFLLPALDATLNAASALLLTLGYCFIRNKKVLAHKIC